MRSVVYLVVSAHIQTHTHTRRLVKMLIFFFSLSLSKGLTYRLYDNKFNFLLEKKKKTNENAFDRTMTVD